VGSRPSQQARARLHHESAPAVRPFGASASGVGRGSASDAVLE
jgi:hypothetical protein